MSNYNIEIKLACVEDGLDNIGFRKLAGYTKSIHSETKVAYIPTGNSRSLMSYILRSKISAAAGSLDDKDISKVADFLSESDLVGFSSMTPYSTTVHKIIFEIRKRNPNTYIVWGGIHPIIHPEDAIKHADAICTGEGEFAFKKFLQLFKSKQDYTTTPSFWFRKDNHIKKNKNLPLMKPVEMNELPPLAYQDGEFIYHHDQGFKKMNQNDFIKYLGLTYSTVWSIGCPLHCTYCGNTKFIEYDNAYRILRHASPHSLIDELKRAISKHPHISTILFHDDSFLALRYETLKEFCMLYKKEINIPFCVYGIIPNYVSEDKIALLLDAGMNRVRMGIQSGSDNILKFYKRPTKLIRIKAATKVFNKYKKFMIAPNYDIILDNPVETTEDTRATVDMLYEMPRPFALNIFSLRTIPNTQLAKDLEKSDIKIPEIDADYCSGYQPTMGNALVFILCFWKIPKWLYKILRNKIYPSYAKQKYYPILFTLAHMIYNFKRALDHLRFMDLSFVPGRVVYYLWKFGVISLWQRLFLKRFKLSLKEEKRLKAQPKILVNP
tara:strand:- start:8 stop:1660 length:1653 start_codon:yes stop_codon:yes gene_type:complete